MGENSATFPHTSQEHHDLCCQGSTVEMGFVEYDTAEVGSKESRVLWPTQHVLQHRIICDHNIWDSTTGFLSCPHPARFPVRFPLLIRTSGILRGLACEMEYSKSLLASKPFIDSVDLICHERVHRVEDQASHSSIFPPFRCGPKICKHRQQESLCLTKSRPSSDNKSWLLSGFRCRGLA